VAWVEETQGNLLYSRSRQKEEAGRGRRGTFDCPWARREKEEGRLKKDIKN